MEENTKKVEEVEVKSSDKKQARKFDKQPQGKRDRRPRNRQRQPKLYEEDVISIGRVTKVTKGGRHFRFSAVVVVGDKKGKLDLVLVKLMKYQMQLRKQFKMQLRTLLMYL